MSDDLCWKVEQACFNAWPAPRQVILDGWALRCAGGPTRRANSANPLHAGAEMGDALIDKVEAFYALQDRPAMFRVPAMVGAIDSALAARGYRLDAPTRTLYGSLGEVPADALAVTIDTGPSPDWLDARDRLSKADESAAAAYRAIIGMIALPCGFASVREAGDIASLAFGVLQDDLLVVESVITDAAARGRGLARQCLSGLFAWAKGQGARDVALQVMAQNDPALALYARLGLSRNLYGYHYRIGREP